MPAGGLAPYSANAREVRLGLLFTGVFFTWMRPQSAGRFSLEHIQRAVWKFF